MSVMENGCFLLARKYWPFSNYIVGNIQNLSRLLSLMVIGKAWWWFLNVSHWITVSTCHIPGRNKPHSDDRQSYAPTILRCSRAVTWILSASPCSLPDSYWRATIQVCLPSTCNWFHSIFWSSSIGPAEFNALLNLDLIHTVIETAWSCS